MYGSTFWLPPSPSDEDSKRLVPLGLLPLLLNLAVDPAMVLGGLLPSLLNLAVDPAIVLGGLLTAALGEDG